MGPDACIFVFMNVEFSAHFFTLLSHPHEKPLYFLFTFYLFPCYHLYIWGFWCFSQQPWRQLVIHSSDILIVYSAHDSHMQVAIKIYIYIYIFFFCFLLLFFFFFTAICKIPSDSHFAFMHFISMGMVLVPVSCTVSRTSIHWSSGTFCIRSSPLTLSDLAP